MSFLMGKRSHPDMKLSTKSRYGTRILMELAMRVDDGPVRVSQISEIQKIPLKYIEQLIRTLKKAGYLESTRGVKGGHHLKTPPENISLGDVVRLFEGQSDLVQCISSPDQCSQSCECKARLAWQEANRVLHEKLDAISIADLIKQEPNDSNGMAH